MTRSNVDLPQPEGPSSVRKLPRGIARSMFSSAVTVPRSVREAHGDPLALDGDRHRSQPTLARSALVASRILVVMTSSSLGAPAVNCFSSS